MNLISPQTSSRKYAKWWRNFPQFFQIGIKMRFFKCHFYFDHPRWMQYILQLKVSKIVILAQSMWTFLVFKNENKKILFTNDVIFEWWLFLVLTTIWSPCINKNISVHEITRFVLNLLFNLKFIKRADSAVNLNFVF